MPVLVKPVSIALENCTTRYIGENPEDLQTAENLIRDLEALDSNQGIHARLEIWEAQLNAADVQFMLEGRGW